MPEVTRELRVAQAMSDRTIDDVSKLDAGTLLADGMSHGSGHWSWTRVELLANDREAEVLVVRWPQTERTAGETVALPYSEAAHLFARWSEVSDRPPFDESTAAPACTYCGKPALYRVVSPTDASSQDWRSDVRCPPCTSDSGATWELIS